MTDMPRRPDPPRRTRWLLRVAVLASAAILVGGALGGLGPTPSVPLDGRPAAPVQAEERGAISVSEALETAEQADIEPATLLAAADVVVGVRADHWNVSVIEFAQVGGRVDRQIVGATTARLGENQVCACARCGPGVAVLYGTAAADIVRVAVAHTRATGGAVTNGAWLVVIESDGDPLALGWAFLRADGSSARHGTGADSRHD